MTATPAPQPGTTPGRAGLVVVASEDAGGYDADPLVVGFTAGLDGLLGRPLDELDEPSVEAEVRVLEHARRRIDARMARATAVLAERHARRAAQANPDDAIRAGQRARRERRNELADQLGWSKAESNSNEQYGRVLDHSPTLAGAADDGQIRSGNAVKLGRFLTRLSPQERTKVEDRALQAARTQDPVTFGRTIDKLRAELCPADAEKAEARRHANRTASVVTTDEGMTRVYAELATVDGALVSRAIDTYRRIDTPGQWRNPAQRTADALVDMARAALSAAGDTDDTAEVPRPERNHGARPHLVVTIPIDVLLAGAGMVDLDGHPVPLGAIRHLMDDAGWAFVITDTNLRPLAVTGESRTVPAGLWRALVQRDGGCIVEGCDHKADWCDVMHLTTPHRDGGRLSLDNAALGCRTHHSAWDNTDRYQLHWQHGRPILRKRSRAGPSP